MGASSLRLGQLRLQHKFRNADLLTQALLHASAPQRKRASNERLEFLGDRVLGLVMAQALYEHFPDASEGELSRRLAVLVSGDNCAKVAQAWGLGQALQYARRPDKAPPSANMLGDACEAVIGAVYLDGGLAAARKLVLHGFQELLGMAEAPIDAKSELQELALRDGLGLPRYRVVDRAGPAHAPRFRIAVAVDGLGEAQADAAKRKSAEMLAAAALLQQIAAAKR